MVIDAMDKCPIRSWLLICGSLFLAAILYLGYEVHAAEVQRATNAARYDAILERLDAIDTKLEDL